MKLSNMARMKTRGRGDAEWDYYKFMNLKKDREQRLLMLFNFGEPA